MWQNVVQILGTVTAPTLLWLAVIFLLAMLTEMGVPTFPVIEGLIVFAGFQIVHGMCSASSLAPFLVLAPAGRLCGSTSTYWLSHSLGDKLVNKFGKRIRITRERLEKTKQKMSRAALPSIIIARLTPGLGVLASVTYGTTRIRFRYFFRGVLIQLLIWEGIYLALGAFGGGLSKLLAPEFHPLFITALVIAVVTIGTAVWFFFFRQTEKELQEEVPTAEEAKN
jgi:membrane protein DedA with SNARE-associated domain